MARHSKRRKPYPPILAERQSKKAQNGAKHLSLRQRIAERRKLYDALWKHFGLIPGDWKSLADNLLSNHVPPFMSDGRGRERNDEPTLQERQAFQDAGGARPYDDRVVAFIQAQFAYAVQDKARTTKAMERAYAELAKRPEALPTRYQKRTTPKSLKQAYITLPEYIRAEPAQFIPGTRAYARAEQMLHDEEERLEQEFREKRAATSR